MALPPNWNPGPWQRWLRRDSLARLSISTRMFLILVIALLPLAVGAVLVADRIADTAKAERDRLVQQNVDDSAARLRDAILDDQEQLLRAADRIALGEDPAELCAQLRDNAARQGRRFGALLYSDASRQPSCTVGPAADALLAIGVAPPAFTARLIPDRGLMMVAAQGNVSVSRVVLGYPASSVLRLADPVDDIALSQFELASGEMIMPLTRLPAPWSDRLNAQIRSTETIDDIALELRYARVPSTPPQTLARIIPFLTILAAAVVGWLVINRMLIRPLTHLQRKMRHYTTGEQLPPMPASPFNASEIEELDSAFLTLTDKVAHDKQALDQGLKQQILLTREVHHRVKNNLQIVASLISLHARTAESREAALAYAKIQRRVDALSVVHRNHFAGSEQAEGINLRALVGELAGSFQQTAEDGEAGGAIAIAIDNVRVSQDVGMPVAFLITEIMELIQLSRPDAPVRLATEPVMEGAIAADRVLLSIASPALGDNPAIDAMLAEGIDRVMTGLARQLRAPLTRDRDKMRYTIAVPVFVPAASERLAAE